MRLGAIPCYQPRIFKSAMNSSRLEHEYFYIPLGGGNDQVQLTAKAFEKVVLSDATCSHLKVILALQVGPCKSDLLKEYASNLNLFGSYERRARFLIKLFCRIRSSTRPSCP
jgi:hypothetical protein